MPARTTGLKTLTSAATFRPLVTDRFQVYAVPAVNTPRFHEEMETADYENALSAQDERLADVPLAS